jgi:hypothetical protein
VDLFQGFIELAYRILLVEQNSFFGSVILSGICKSCAHIGDRKVNLLPFRRPEFFEKESHSLLRGVFQFKRNRSVPQKITDHDQMSVCFSSRDLVNADHVCFMQSRTLQFLLKVLPLQGLYRIPVRMQLTGNICDRLISTLLHYIKSKSLLLERLARKLVQFCLSHLLAASAIYLSGLQV